jgi:hypothetical protein
MNINIDIKRKFIINGKEYKSIEKIPQDIHGAREFFRNLIDSQLDSDYRISSVLTPTKIIFNGTEYETIESMPQDVRQLYEKVLKAAESGAPPSGVDIAGISSGKVEKPVTNSRAFPGATRKPPKDEPSFFLPTFLVSAGLMALFLLIHYLLQIR